MRLQLSGKEVMVWFAHDHTPKVLKTVHRGQVIENPYKAETTCLLSVDEEQFFGSAYCAITDQFDKAKGRKVAFSRALKAGRFDKATRTALWQSYFAQVKG